MHLKNRAIVVNPKKINFLQFPEFFSFQKNNKIMQFQSKKINNFDYLSGNWDNISLESVNWSGVYEQSQCNTAMIPLDNYVFFHSLKERFKNKKSWNKTKWVQWLYETPQVISRYENHKKIQMRLRMIDKLYFLFRQNRYDLHITPLPVINIGRNKKISIEDGRHRICLAKIAQVRSIKVYINFIHESVRNKL